MSPLFESLIADHAMRVNKMTRVCLTRFQYKIDNTTLLHKIIIVYTLRLAPISMTYNCMIPRIPPVINLVMRQKMVWHARM